MQLDEPFAVLVGQRPQQHAIDDAENRRIGANAEGHRDDDDERTTRIAAQAANAVADVGVELALFLHAPEQRVEADGQSANHWRLAMVQIPASTRATADDRRSQLRVSSASCFRPSRVSW